MTIQELAKRLPVLVEQNADKVNQYKPVRSYEGNIFVGCPVEVTYRDKQKLYENLKFVGVVSKIVSYPNYSQIFVEFFENTEHFGSDEWHVHNNVPFIRKASRDFLVRSLDFTKADNSAMDCLFVKINKLEGFKLAEAFEKSYQVLREGFHSRWQSVKDDENRKKQEEAERKIRMIEEQKRAEKENEIRRAQKADITVGQLEDILNRLDALEQSDNCLEHRLSGSY